MRPHLNQWVDMMMCAITPKYIGKHKLVSIQACSAIKGDYLKNNQNKKGWSMTQVVSYLSSNPQFFSKK
jgi:hypothetical protein